MVSIRRIVSIVLRLVAIAILLYILLGYWAGELFLRGEDYLVTDNTFQITILLQILALEGIVVSFFKWR